jgi:hypothetical protein
MKNRKEQKKITQVIIHSTIKLNSFRSGIINQFQSNSVPSASDFDEE